MELETLKTEMETRQKETEVRKMEVEATARTRNIEMGTKYIEKFSDTLFKKISAALDAGDIDTTEHFAEICAKINGWTSLLV